MGGPGGFCVSGPGQERLMEFSERHENKMTLANTYRKEEHPRLRKLVKYHLGFWRAENFLGDENVKQSVKHNAPIQKLTLKCTMPSCFQSDTSHR